MLRIIFIIVIIMISIPIYNAGRDFFKDKYRKAEIAGETTIKAIKYKYNED